MIIIPNFVLFVVDSFFLFWLRFSCVQLMILGP